MQNTQVKMGKHLILFTCAILKDRLDELVVKGRETDVVRFVTPCEGRSNPFADIAVAIVSVCYYRLYLLGSENIIYQLPQLMKSRGWTTFLTENYEAAIRVTHRTHLTTRGGPMPLCRIADRH